MIKPISQDIIDRVNALGKKMDQQKRLEEYEEAVKNLMDLLIGKQHEILNLKESLSFYQQLLDGDME